MVMKRFQPLILFSFLVAIANNIFAQQEKAVVNNSYTAFTIPQKDLIPENLAYNPADKCFYVGSTHHRKVVKVTAEGNVSDFIKDSQNGEWMVVGMKIDSSRQHLWFCSSIGDVMQGYHDGDFGTHTGVFKYDLRNGKLIRKYILEKTNGLHFFNDLVLDGNGNVYLTDMPGNAVYAIYAVKDSLQMFSQLSGFTDPNGIALSADEKKLFLATNEGLAVMNLQTKETSLIKHDSVMKTRGIDGLYFYKNTLVAVQNGYNRIMQFYLTSSMDEIKTSRIIESNHPFFSMNPTTGVIVGNMFYYISNSQFGSFKEGHEIFPSDQLYEVVVLKTILPD